MYKNMKKRKNTECEGIKPINKTGETSPIENMKTISKEERVLHRVQNMFRMMSKIKNEGLKFDGEVVQFVGKALEKPVEFRSMNKLIKYCKKFPISPIHRGKK